MTQFAGENRLFAQDAWCTSVLSVGPPGPVVRLQHGRDLRNPGEDLDHGAGATVLLDGADTGRVPLDGDPEAGEPLTRTVDVVGFIDSDTQRDQPTGRALDDTKLLAAVTGRKRRAVT